MITDQKQIRFTMGILHDPNRPQDHVGHHGPIDGVLPQNYPETYAPLLSLFCVRQNRYRIYISDTMCICTECYTREIMEPERYVMENHLHAVCADEEAQLTSTCDQCDEDIAWIGAAAECARCTEEYLNLSNEEYNGLINGNYKIVEEKW